MEENKENLGNEGESDLFGVLEQKDELIVSLQSQIKHLHSEIEKRERVYLGEPTVTGFLFSANFSQKLCLIKKGCRRYLKLKAIFSGLKRLPVKLAKKLHRILRKLYFSSFNPLAVLKRLLAFLIRSFAGCVILLLLKPLLKLVRLFGKESKISKPLVSFIVPLYNKEKYIVNTLKSIERCSYPNKEVIVVDDRSTDASISLVEKFQKRSSLNIIVVPHAENKGLSSSRNTGLEVAKGKYIQFWDADDIYFNKLGGLVRLMEENNTDIATAIARRNGRIAKAYRKAAKLKLEKKTNFFVNQDVFLNSSTCFKLYRKGFLDKHQLRFVEGLYMQDTEFNFRAFLLAKSVMVTPYILGNYLSVKGSGSKSFNEGRIRSSIIIERHTRKFLEDNGLSAFEGYRQKILLGRCFEFFTLKLLRLWVADHEHEYVSYLSEYQKIFETYEEGFCLLIKDNPIATLGCLAVSVGQYAWARKILNGRLSEKELPELLNSLQGSVFAPNVLSSLFSVLFMRDGK